MKSINAKVVLLGDQGVGKTSISVRHFNKKYPSKVTSTIGASFLTSKIHIEDYKVTLHVWDTAGHERFKAMAPMFYRNANVAILVYDITCSQTFNEIQYWVTELSKNIEGKIVLFVVGNKLDLSSKREVTFTEAQTYADSIGANYFETSALTNEGIEDLFTQLAVESIKLFQEKAIQKLQSSDCVHVTDMTRKNEVSDDARPIWCC